MAYKKFLEAKQAQEEFRKLKERLQTASPEEKEEIRKQLEAIEAQKVAELAKKRAAAEKREAERTAKEQEAIASAAKEFKQEREASNVTYTASDLTSIKVEGPPKYYVGEYYNDYVQRMYPWCIHTTADTHDDQLDQDPEAAKQLASIQKEVEAIEVKSELEMQKVQWCPVQDLTRTVVSHA